MLIEYLELRVLCGFLSLQKIGPTYCLITTNQGLCVTGELDPSHVAGRTHRGMGSQRKQLNIDMITKDRIFPCTHVVLEVIQVINSYGDRTVHYIVSSSTRTEC